MKVRLLAVMAVVVVGVMAGTSPAMAQNAKTASSKSQWTKQHKDNVAFGGAIHTLRKQVDSTNGALTTITVAALEALTALKDNLTAVAAVTTEFKYAVVQVAAATGGDGDGIVGFGPTMFFETGNLQKTGAAQTVTFPIPAGGGAAVKLYTAIRSAYPDKGKVGCRVTISTPGVAVATKVTNGDVLGGYFHEMPQSKLVPKENDPDNATFPIRLIATEDNAVNLGDAGYLVGGLVAPTGATSPRLGTLTCIRYS